MLDAKLPLSFWAEAVSAAVYSRNITPTGVLNWNTPEDVYVGKKPSIGHLKVSDAVHRSLYQELAALSGNRLQKHVYS